MYDRGEWRVVKTRRWDCPSCGLDRKRVLVNMCLSARVTRIVTLTLKQPYACPPGTLTRSWSVPEGFDACDPVTHVYFHVASGTWRWMRIGACEHCCRWVSKMLSRWRDRMRYRWPGFQYLHVRESHKSGALHLHLAVTGVPASITRTSKAGLLLKGAWADLGGGFVDVGRHGDHAGSAAGWYVGKYLAKRQEHGMAPGFRRWTRSAEFGPDVRMTPQPRAPDDDGGWAEDVAGAPIVLRHWLTPAGVETPRRWWPSQDRPAAPTARLDTRTANSGISPAGVGDLEAWSRSWASRRGGPVLWNVRPAPGPAEWRQEALLVDVAGLAARDESARRAARASATELASSACRAW
jgi:hypothetical protein